MQNNIVFYREIKNADDPRNKSRESEQSENPHVHGGFRPFDNPYFKKSSLLGLKTSTSIASSKARTPCTEFDGI